jgi:hypothetical protein
LKSEHKPLLAMQVSSPLFDPVVTNEDRWQRAMLDAAITELTDPESARMFRELQRQWLNSGAG